MGDEADTGTQKIIAIVGPTASGKTSLAIEIAKKFDGEIISADSRQVYKGLNIGTEKVTQEEMGGVPHHLIDVCEPTETFSVQQFKDTAEKTISDIESRGSVPIVAGGSGFYIDALLYNLDFPEVPPNIALREELEQKETRDLYRMLREKDADRAVRVDEHNRRRLIRALEIVEALGKVPDNSKNNSPYDALVVGIETDNQMLKKKIKARLKESLKKGLVAEVENLHDAGISWERMNEFGLEYRVAGEFIRGEIDKKEMEQKMLSELYKYVKRQKTWFKRNDAIEWHALEDSKKIFKIVEKFLKG